MNDKKAQAAYRPDQPPGETMSDPICGVRIPTWHPHISWTCHQPLLHDGPHSPAIYDAEKEQK